MEFTLVLTVVLGLCVGAVVADVLFGPEQPATSSSGSHGDQWDPWRSWLRKGRRQLAAVGLWLRRSGERGWAALARSFPAQGRNADGPPPDILPPPVAPPLHAPVPEPVAEPRVVAPPPVAAFVDQRLEVAPRTPVATAPRRVAYEPVQPMVVKVPTRVRVKAGMGLVVYVTLAGLALGVVVLMVAGIVARAAGQI